MPLNQATTLSLNVTNAKANDLRLRMFTLTPARPSVKFGRSSSRSQNCDRDSPKFENALFSSPVVSRTHAEISVDPNGNSLSIQDLDSTHGTLVNGEKIHANQPHHLNQGDTITLGIPVKVHDSFHKPPELEVTWVWHPYDPQTRIAGSGEQIVVDPTSKPLSSNPSTSIFTVPDVDSDDDPDYQASDRQSESASSCSAAHDSNGFVAGSEGEEEEEKDEEVVESARDNGTALEKLRHALSLLEPNNIGQLPYRGFPNLDASDGENFVWDLDTLMPSEIAELLSEIQWPGLSKTSQAKGRGAKNKPPVVERPKNTAKISKPRVIPPNACVVDLLSDDEDDQPLGDTSVSNKATSATAKVHVVEEDEHCSIQQKREQPPDQWLSDNQSSRTPDKQKLAPVQGNQRTTENGDIECNLSFRQNQSSESDEPELDECCIGMNENDSCDELLIAETDHHSGRGHLEPDRVSPIEEEVLAFSPENTSKTKPVQKSTTESPINPPAFSSDLVRDNTPSPTLSDPTKERSAMKRPFSVASPNQIQHSPTVTAEEETPLATSQMPLNKQRSIRQLPAIPAQGCFHSWKVITKEGLNAEAEAEQTLYKQRHRTEEAKEQQMAQEQLGASQIKQTCIQQLPEKEIMQVRSDHRRKRGVAIQRCEPNQTTLDLRPTKRSHATTTDGDGKFDDNVTEKEPPKKRAKGWDGQFLKGVVVGGAAVLGALIALPESFF